MFSIRISLFVFLFLLLKTVLSQQKEAIIIESKEFDQEFNEAHKDTLNANKKNGLDEKVKQISDNGNIIGDNCKAKVLHSKKLKLSSGKVIYLTFVEITDGSLLSGQKITQKWENRSP